MKRSSPSRLLKRTKLNPSVLFSILIVAILAGVYLTFFSGAATLKGDINVDNKVDIADLSLLLSSYGNNAATCKTATNFTCDISTTADNKVDIADLSVLLSNYGKVGTVTPPPPPPIPPPTPPSSGTLVRSDDASQIDPTPLWGTIECANSSRHARLTENGVNFRRLTVVDGDDFYGERCELGRNEHRYGLSSATNKAGTFYLYQEGEHDITSFYMRLPANFPIGQGDWQVVMQMKQAQPYGENQVLAQENTPILSMEARENKWIVSNHGNTKWAGPTARLGTWIFIKWDVVYSKDPSKGKLQVTIDGTASPTFTMKTLVSVKETGNGFNVGDPIPGHLRIGLYHNQNYPGTYLDFRNLQITKL